MQKSLAMDPSSIYGQGGMQSKPGIANAGINPGVGGLTLKGWPLTIHMPQIQQSTSQQQQDPLHTQHLVQDDIEHFGDVGSLDDNVESFLSQDDGDGDGRDLFGTLKQNPSEHATDASKDFSFSEVGSIRKSNSKVVCCHFSSDGRVLASAGHDKKVVLWNMETLQTESTPEEHTLIITDVRFRPNSTQLATSSFDTTVRLWDTANTSFSLQAYSGHTSHVMSLDFHPKKSDLFCSCDVNNEIRFWNISQYSCTRSSKGGSAQVRFQPRTGHLLAAAAGSVVSLFDVETDRQMHSLQGHTTDIHSVCWDTNGDYLASESRICESMVACLWGLHS